MPEAAPSELLRIEKLSAGAVVALVAIVLACALLAQLFQRRLDAEKGPRNPGWPRLFLSPSSLTRAARVLNSHPALPMLTAMGVAFSITQSCITAFTATYMVTERGQSLAQAGRKGGSHLCGARSLGLARPFRHEDRSPARAVTRPIASSMPRC